MSLTLHLRRALLLGLAWALVWAPVAVLVGTQFVDPDNSMDEMWVAIGAYPGFLCAIVFCAVLAIAERDRPLEELPLARAGAWGALAGLIVGVFPFTVGTPTNKLPLWVLAATVIGSITLMSAASAVVSASIMRRRQASASSSEVA